MIQCSLSQVMLAFRYFLRRFFFKPAVFPWFDRQQWSVRWRRPAAPGYSKWLQQPWCCTEHSRLYYTRTHARTGRQIGKNSAQTVQETTVLVVTARFKQRVRRTSSGRRRRRWHGVGTRVGGGRGAHTPHRAAQGWDIDLNLGGGYGDGGAQTQWRDEGTTLQPPPIPSATFMRYKERSCQMYRILARI